MAFISDAALQLHENAANVIPYPAAGEKPIFPNRASIERVFSRKDWANTVTKNWADFRTADELAETVANYDQQIDKIWRIYMNGFNGKFPFFLLGDTKSRSNEHIVFNMGTLCSTETGLPPGKSDTLRDCLFHSSVVPDGATRVSRTSRLIHEDCWEQFRNQHFFRGAILNTSDWWPLVNVSAMLGVIHKNREVHIAIKCPIPNDLIFDSSKGRLRVLGSEIAMLRAAGYTVAWTKVGTGADAHHQFTLIPPKVPSEMTFQEAQVAIRDTTVDMIQSYLLNPTQAVAFRASRSTNSSPSPSDNTSPAPSDDSTVSIQPSPSPHNGSPASSTSEDDDWKF